MHIAYHSLNFALFRRLTTSCLTAKYIFVVLDFWAMRDLGPSNFSKKNQTVNSSERKTRQMSTGIRATDEKLEKVTVVSTTEHT